MGHKLDLDAIDRSMIFHGAESVTISCGTVTLDPAAGKVLVVFNRKLQIYQLPKGRKNIGEDLLSAAVRETLEETGVRVTPLPLKIATRATPCSDGRPGQSQDQKTNPIPNSISKTTKQQQQPKRKLQKSPEVTADRPSNEFLAVCSYPDPQASAPTVKSVYYFAATADSTLPLTRGDQEDWEDLDPAWIPVSQTGQTLRFRGEGSVVEKALRDARQTGYVIAG